MGYEQGKHDTCMHATKQHMSLHTKGKHIHTYVHPTSRACTLASAGSMGLPFRPAWCPGGRQATKALRARPEITCVKVKGGIVYRA